jgi:hypothetical protein
MEEQGLSSLALPPSRHARSRVGTKELMRALWQGRWLLCSITALGVALAAIYLHIATPTYTVSIVAVPRAAPTSAANSIIDVALPGLTQKAQSDAVERLNVMLGSLRLAQELEKRFGLMRQIFASQWDSKTQSFVAPTSLQFRIKEELKKILGLRPWSPPTVQDLAAYVANAVKVGTSNGIVFGPSQIIRISLEGQDPEFTETLLRNIYMTVDSLVRADKAVEYAHDIDYLKRESATATQVDLHVALAQMLAEQIKNDMLLGEGESYLVNVIEWPYVPDRPTSPNGRLVLLFGFILGGMVAVGAALLYGLPSHEDASPTRLSYGTSRHDHRWSNATAAPSDAIQSGVE